MYYRENDKVLRKSCQLLGVPGQSPSPVLTWPCIALLWSSDGIRHFRCSMVDGYYSSHPVSYLVIWRSTNILSGTLKYLTKDTKKKVYYPNVWIHTLFAIM